MYIITIQKKETRKVPRRKWLQVRSCPKDAQGYSTHDHKEYDYVDDEWFEEESTKVYEQTVDDLDLKAVIVAVNVGASQ